MVDRMIIVFTRRAMRPLVRLRQSIRPRTKTISAARFDIGIERRPEKIDENGYGCYPWRVTINGKTVDWAESYSWAVEIVRRQMMAIPCQ
jgi:hypothetical protein